MIRPVLTEVGIFLIPFAIYAGWLIATRAGLLDPASWPLSVVIKLITGALLLTLIVFLLLAHFSGAPPGATYTPARIDETGKFIPGSDK